MSDARLDPRLEALLADVPAPPVPTGLAERIVAAATAVAQQPRAGRARRAADPRHDRRRRWLRRPLLVGVCALGLALSGAVAATLAGVPIPAKIAAVFSQAFPGEEKPEPKAQPPRRARPPRPATAPARSQAAASDRPAALIVPAVPMQRRLAIARGIVAERRAAGLPTPIADRVERRILRWQAATPAERAALREARRQRWRQRLETRRALLRERAGPAVVRPSETALAPPRPAPIRRPQAPAAAPQPRPVYGPIDQRANVEPRRRDENAFRLHPRNRDRDRLGGPVAGRPGVVRPRVAGPAVRRPAPMRPRRR
ncbi:MAG TPA: hypothetical protein VEX35_09305 [Allosphingosinicella sp.]|nr:hypothetical protein [Allosphingosinicella sp.]